MTAGINKTSLVTEGVKWILVYIGTYLLGPFLASLIYWGIAFFFTELNAIAKYQMFYFVLAMLVQTGVCFTLVYMLFLRSKKRTWSFAGFVSPRKGHIFFYGILGGLLLITGILFFSVLMALFQTPVEPQYFGTLVIQENSLGQLVLLVLCGSFLAPVVEEMLFRGLLYQGLRQCFSAFPAMCIAGLIFGISHFDIWRVIPLTFGGIILCWIYEKTGSIWVTIIAHGLWNAIMTGLVLL